MTLMSDAMDYYQYFRGDVSTNTIFTEVKLFDTMSRIVRRDKETIERLFKSLEPLRPLDPTGYANCSQILIQAITKGPPFPELQRETKLHVIVAQVIAQESRVDRSELLEVNWRALAKLMIDGIEMLWDTKRDIAVMIPELIRRPLFGKEAARDWGWYGFISASDGLRLAQAIEEIKWEDNTSFPATVHQMADFLRTAAANQNQVFVYTGKPLPTQEWDSQKERT